MSAPSKEIRLHIGNISPKLASNAETLNTRLGKFGEIIKPLEVRTKPLGDKFFGFITMNLTPVDYEKIRNAFHDVVFMGMKLSVNEAKPAFNWQKDHERPDAKKLDRIKRDRIQQVRELRINEAHTRYPENNETHSLLTPTQALNPNNSSIGYLKSSHTTNNKSGNTKNKPPGYTLQGTKSYSTLAGDTSKSLILEQYARTSGNGEVIKGRHRATVRPPRLQRAATLRILINGELKTYKNYKTKLWGFEKNKTALDLTWKYENGVWKSGDDHIVEKVSRNNVIINDRVIGGPQVISCGVSGDEVQLYGRDSNNGQVELGDFNGSRSIDPEFKEDIDKNQKILASLFTKYDFDKPLSVEEEVDKIDENDITYDSKGRKKIKSYDYEVEGAENDDDFDNDSDESFDYSTAQQKVEEFTKLHERPQEEVYYDEDDDGNELDFDLIAQSTEKIKDKYEEDHDTLGLLGEDTPMANAEEVKEVEGDDDDDEEFIPSFGQVSKESDSVLGKTNNTEALRSLFNKEQESGFKLEVDEDDIDEEKEKELNDPTYQQTLLKEIEQKQQQDAQIHQELRRNQFGLFWTHKDSPFLSTQSQLNKIGTAEDVITLPGEIDGANLEVPEGEENAYEKWFWDQRGELSRECKRRRRDVMRAFKKKVNA